MSADRSVRLDPSVTVAGAIIEFCGQHTPVDRDPFTIGRDADLVIADDNRFLHRVFLHLTTVRGVWLLSNVGTRLSATVADPDGRLEASLAPGARLPLVADRTLVQFSAGPTVYELAVLLLRPVSDLAGPEHDGSGDHTIGRTALTPDQRLLVLVLAEPSLSVPGLRIVVPPSRDAARRLGWTVTKFNRKLDNVCHKLAAQGVRGLHGAPGRLASNRRVRLVEHAVASGLVTRDDLRLLGPPVDGRS